MRIETRPKIESEMSTSKSEILIPFLGSGSDCCTEMKRNSKIFTEPTVTLERIHSDLVSFIFLTCIPNGRPLRVNDWGMLSVRKTLETAESKLEWVFSRWQV